MNKTTIRQSFRDAVDSYTNMKALREFSYNMASNRAERMYAAKVINKGESSNEQ